jgi:hypothetical protein
MAALANNKKGGSRPSVLAERLPSSRSHPWL